MHRRAVRATHATSALLLTLLLAAPATAHDDHEAECDRRAEAWSHLDVWDLELGPNGTAERTMAFEGCPFQEGWRMLLRGEADGRVQVAAVQANETLAEVAWNDDSGFTTYRAAHGERMTLRVRNLDDANSTLRVYYDQTCLCPLKGARIAPGPVWMNALAQQGQTVRFELAVAPTGTPGLPEPPGNVTVRALHADAPGLERTWTLRPDSDPACRAGISWVGCLEYAFEAPVDGRQDVLVWLDHDGGPEWSIALRPVIQVQEEERRLPGTDAPGLPLVGVLAAGALALAVGFRRRAR